MIGGDRPALPVIRVTLRHQAATLRSLSALLRMRAGELGDGGEVAQLLDLADFVEECCADMEGEANRLVDPNAGSLLGDPGA